jgi:group I intron endonuclease
MIGIYKITSPTNKVYIGQSIDVERRFKMYKRLHHCKKQKKLYNSFIKHNVLKHIFEIIEECDITLLNKRERYWQDFYNVLVNGLNCRLTTTLDKSGTMSNESKKKMSEAQIKNYNKGYKHPMLGIKGFLNKNTGLKRDKNVCIKISNAQKENYKKGRIKSSCKMVLDTENGIFYESVVECYLLNSNQIKVSKNSFRRKLSNVRVNNTKFLYI